MLYWNRWISLLMVGEMALEYVNELEKFDEKLGELLSLLKEDDLLIITADHRKDLTHTGKDHTREKSSFPCILARYER